MIHKYIRFQNEFSNSIILPASNSESCPTYPDKILLRHSLSKINFNFVEYLDTQKIAQKVKQNNNLDQYMSVLWTVATKW